MSRTYEVKGETLADRTVEQVAEEIETLAHELRSVRALSTREQLASTIMHLAADIRVSVEGGENALVLNFTYDANGMDESARLLYLWEIHDSITGMLIARYLGKAENGIKRRREEYRGNVGRLLAGRPYRKGNPDGFRAIHRALAEAVRQNHRITLRLLRNVPGDENIFAAERAMIHALQCSLNG